MGVQRSMLAVLVVLGGLLLVPRLSQAASPDVEDYCCVCTACPAGASRQCLDVKAIGKFDTPCAINCAMQGCQFVDALEGNCNLNAGACLAAQAPTTSRPVLVVLGVLLAGAGVYRVRRRCAGLASEP